MDVIENLPLENEETAVDPYSAVIDRANARHQTAVSFLNGHHVIAQVWANAEKTGNFVLLVKVSQLLRKRQIGEAVAIVSQKLVFPFEVLLHGLETLRSEE